MCMAQTDIAATGKTEIGSVAQKTHVWEMSSYVVSRTILGCIVHDIPMVTSTKENPLDVIRTGDRVRVDADRGVVTVTRRAPEVRD